MNPAPKATTPEEYLASLPEPRQSELRALDAAIRKAAPSLQPGLGHGMLGYGPIHYRYASGREGDTFVVCLASQKQHISIYLYCSAADGYCLDQKETQLGKVSVGKGCVRFKKLEDLRLPALLALVEKLSEAVKKGGRRRATREKGVWQGESDARV